MNRSFAYTLSIIFGGLVGVGCGEDSADLRPVTVSFEATVGALQPSCSTTYENLGATNVTAQLADARLFISGVELRDDNGDWVPVRLTDNDWQREGVALLDFEDGTGACSDSGTDETNTEVVGEIEPGTYAGVRFRVGVPFELNHNDNATAPAPLNAAGMFWNWRGGYKFVRVDWLVEGGAVPRWNVHVGSTGCVSDAPVLPPDAVCGRPNVATVELAGIAPDTDRATIDLARLVDGADLTTNTATTPPGCMSDPMEPNECAPVFSALGLAFETGLCTDGCNAQTLFGVATLEP